MDRAVVYARLSDVRKGDRDGIERQVREGETHADRLGVEVVERLIDNDVTAAKRKRRPAFDRLMAGIAANEWQVVVLRSLDRWVRRPAELEEIITVVEASKVRVEAIHGTVDLRTRQGRLNARLVTAVAMAEVEATTERVIDWHADRAQQGVALHGPVGYGFAKVDGMMMIVEEEAARVREAARRLIDGEALAAIARSWNEAGSSLRGSEWRGSKIRRTLLAPRVTGLRVHQGQVIGEAQWPPILDRVTWERAKAILDRPERDHGGTRKAKLLTGIATCWKCHATLNTGSIRQTRRYICRHCHAVMVSAARLEEHVTTLLFTVVDTPLLARTFHKTPDVDEEETAGQIRALESDLVALGVAVGAGEIPVVEWRPARDGITARLSDLRSRLARPERRPWAGSGQELAARWDVLGIAEQRRVLLAWVDVLEVGPAVRGVNRFDGRRVQLEWRV